MSKLPEVVVAGHICLDIIPVIPQPQGGSAHSLAPGTLTEVGPPVVSTGGAVSNTGLALHRLGIPTRLAAKVGDDLFGQAILSVLEAHDPELARGMIVSPGETSSYTVVISPPNTDRIFLHCPGANNTFGASDLRDEAFRGARLFHFGYPPLMRRMWEKDGAELKQVLKQAKSHGLTTSLDMAKPDPQSPAGQADWPSLLGNVLPLVDVFLPSFEEILFMLNRRRFDSLCAEAGAENVFALVTTDLLREVADSLIELGVAVVVLKLGNSGLYVRTGSDTGRWGSFGACVPTDLETWLNRELLAPCYKVNVVGTTGAGDCTIAGFLGALLKGLAPQAAMTRAVAVGACNVEKADATSGIPSWDVVEERIRGGGPRLAPSVKVGDGWTWKADPGILISPEDAGVKGSV